MRYIAGIMTSVKKVANVNPKIMVQDMGPKKIVLSPPM